LKEKVLRQPNRWIGVFVVDDDVHDE